MIRYQFNPWSPYVMMTIFDEPGFDDEESRVLINRSTGTYWLIFDDDSEESVAVIGADKCNPTHQDAKFSRYLQVKVAFMFGIDFDYGSLN